MWSKPSRAIFEPDEHAEVRDLGDFPLHDLTGLVLAWNITRPGIVLQLLEAESDAASILIHRQHFALHLLSFFQHFVGMADLAGPGHVGNVQQSVDAFLQLDERSVIRHIANAPRNNGLDREAIGDIVPRIGLGLFHTQRQLLTLFVDGQDHHFDVVADTAESRWDD